MTIRFHKVVGALPGSLDANAIYAVRTGVGFDLHVTDATGQIAHSVNSGLPAWATPMQPAADPIPTGWHELAQMDAGGVMMRLLTATPPAAMQRIASAASDTVLFAAHSFVQTAWGGVTSDGQHGGILYSDWPGATLSDFVPFGSTRALWELDGNARNAAYDQIIISEVADLGTGFPVPGPAMVETLQHMFWFGQTAAARGAELVLFQPWSPVTPDLDASADAGFAYAREWLQNHLGTPVWIIPAGAYVRALRAEFGDGIFSDGLHLSPGSRYPRGISYLVASFLTKARCTFVRPGDEDIDQLAWEILQAREEAGFGGSTVITPAAIADPLPSPVGLPGAPVPVFVPLDGRMILSGHSLTDTVMSYPWPGLYHTTRESMLGASLDTARSAKSTIPGSAAKYRWDDLNDDLESPNDARHDIALYDGMTITDRGNSGTGVAAPDDADPTLFREDLTALRNFLFNALDNGRAGRATRYAYQTHWADLDGSMGDWRAVTVDYGRRALFRVQWLEHQARQAYADLPSDFRIPIIPGHLLMVQIAGDVAAGLVPGVSSFASLFKDTIHPNEDGGLLDTALAWLFAAVLHGENPEDYPDLAAGAQVTAPQAAYLKPVIWEIASTYAHARLGGTDGRGEVGYDPLTDPDPLDEGGGEEPGGDLPEVALTWAGSTYEGPTRSGTLPAVTGEVLNFTGSAVIAPLALINGFYAVMVVRNATWPANATGTLIQISPNIRAWAKPLGAIQYSGWTNPRGFFVQTEYAGAQWPEGVRIGDATDGDWLVVEGWIFGPDQGGRAGAGADQGITAAEGTMTATADVAFFADVAGESAGIKVMNRMPTEAERTALRAWAQTRITAAGA